MSGIDSRFEGMVPMASGSMGSIYKAWDRVTGQPVAVKVPALAQVHRFWREARVLAQMKHPNIVAYVDSGRSRDGMPWLAMEWLEGEDLETRLLRGPLSVGETVAIGQNVASALAWAHARGFMHRDLKPSNLLVLDRVPFAVKILDFGLARPTGGAGFTATGMFIGTIEYIAPEQADDAKRANERSDVYSFGAVLFHCLAGATPFGEGAPFHRAANGSVPDLCALRLDVPRSLAQLITRMLSRAPRDRPADGAEVAAALADLSRDGQDEWEVTTKVLTHSDIYPSVGPSVDLFGRTAECPPPQGPSGTVVMPAPASSRKGK